MRSSSSTDSGGARLDHDPAQTGENFRKAFHGFNPEKIARYGKRDFERLMKNEGIIRSNAKIKAAIKGAQALARHRREGAGRVHRTHLETRRRQAAAEPLQIDEPDPPPRPRLSEGLSKELKQRGFNFVGPVIVYAFAQAVGMVNDHVVTCHRHAACEKLGKAHTRDKASSKRHVALRGSPSARTSG